MLAVAALVVIAVVVGVAVASLGGSSGKKAGASSGTTASHGSTRAKARLKTHARPGSSVSQTTAASLPVTVLNGTETPGLAHRFSAALQQSGYSQAAAVGGRPPGSGQVSLVQYSAGHQAEAQAIARSLSISNVQPLESTVAALAGSAKVVVIVGADKAASSP